MAQKEIIFHADQLICLWYSKFVCSVNEFCSLWNNFAYFAWPVFSFNGFRSALWACLILKWRVEFGLSSDKLVFSIVWHWLTACKLFKEVLMIESQASCFTSFCSNSNKQTTEVVSKEPNMPTKTHACTVCLWLTDEMFNISIRSWFPLWLPPSRLMFRSDSFFIIFFILCPTLPLCFFFSKVYFLCILPVTSPCLYVDMWLFCLVFDAVSDIPSHQWPWCLAWWDLACQEPVCLFWSTGTSCCGGPSGYMLSFK